MERFVRQSSSKQTEGDTIDVTPFLLNAALKESPSEFEVLFIHGGNFYQYGFSADRFRVHHEWLFFRSGQAGSRTRSVFYREYNSEIDDYEWQTNDTLLRGERELWKSSTRSNALFLSTAVQLNAECLKEPFDWFRYYLRVIESPERLHPNTTAKLVAKPDGKETVLSFLQSVDLKVDDVSVEQREFVLNERITELFSASFIDSLQKVGKEVKDYRVRLKHTGGDGTSADFELEDESDGTRVLFSLAGPLADTLTNGYTVVVDELHNSLHPMALRHIVGMFHDDRTNMKKAQIIFTSHETSVLAKDFMHRDQVWLVEKSKGNATRLVPLSDFKVRELDAFQKNYLAGKYGALPRLKGWSLEQRAGAGSSGQS